jgi:hypothetical protein
MDGFALFGVEQKPRGRPTAAKPRGRRIALPTSWPAPAQPRRSVLPARVEGVMALPHPDWIFHRLSLSGPADQLAAFNRAASGAGVIPWHYDYDRMEEDWFHLMVAPKPSMQRSISIAGARTLARQLRELVWEQHEAAVSQVGVAKGCCFDLHQLVPVPPEFLRLGPDDPASLAWMWEHWGTTWPLRHVRRTQAGCEFWSADWTPWRAIQTIRLAWPELRIDIVPSLAGG